MSSSKEAERRNMDPDLCSNAGVNKHKLLVKSLFRRISSHQTPKSQREMLTSSCHPTMTPFSTALRSETTVSSRCSLMVLLSTTIGGVFDKTDNTPSSKQETKRARETDETRDQRNYKSANLSISTGASTFSTASSTLKMSKQEDESAKKFSFRPDYTSTPVLHVPKTSTPEGKRKKSLTGKQLIKFDEPKQLKASFEPSLAPASSCRLAAPKPAAVSNFKAKIRSERLKENLNPENTFQLLNLLKRTPSCCSICCCQCRKAAKRVKRKRSEHVRPPVSRPGLDTHKHAQSGSALVTCRPINIFYRNHHHESHENFPRFSSSLAMAKAQSQQQQRSHHRIRKKASDLKLLDSSLVQRKCKMKFFSYLNRKNNRLIASSSSQVALPSAKPFKQLNSTRNSIIINQSPPDQPRH